MRALRRIPAVLMRGGTSKGLFFHADALPGEAAARDRLLLRAVGSPDPYGKQIDGLGGGSSSTSKVVLVSRSARPDCDIDYLFGAVAIDAPLIDWSGNCGNLTAAVGPFAITEGLVAAPPEGVATVRIWQVNIGRIIHAQVLMQGGEVVEEGDFVLDGVAFPSAPVRLAFLDPAGGEDPDTPMFPTGRPCDQLEVAGIGRIDATLINAGNPTVFIHAAALGLTGTELQDDVNNRPELLARCEAIRAHGAVAMGLAASEQDATQRRPATPKLAFVAAPQSYVAAGGRSVSATEFDFLARILSMGRLHHAMTGTGAVALAVAAAIPGTVVQRIAAFRGAQSHAERTVCFGHPSGLLTVGARAQWRNDRWTVERVTMQRSARRLMEGWVRLPA